MIGKWSAPVLFDRMRAYHFLSAEYGLQAVEKRQLKVSRWDRLNDPFEFFSLDITDKDFRRSVKAKLRTVNNTTGLICFSKSWKNPVQWSHSADRHHGLCLGFDIDDEHLCPVNYSAERIKSDEKEMASFLNNDPDRITEIIYTKFEHWRYEEEVRMLTTLQDLPKLKDLYFQPFSKIMNLREIIVGANNRSTKPADLRAALGASYNDVSMFKARASFSRFEMVRQQSEALWS
ncbi:MAG TPA: DUF2971 domain-containing protein [Sphingopyxis sp.]|jgi:hypothetical protein|uniref:DUF2971 domain-containing protein n=1 Tax=Sphingopyxis sp. TaxID=1908224 RepID=UPI002E0DDFA8|nr:DUF2971 domain-containing protein [Sphingopyxis sp.]